MEHIQNYLFKFKGQQLKWLQWLKQLLQRESKENARFLKKELQSGRHFNSFPERNAQTTQEVRCLWKGNRFAILILQRKKAVKAYSHHLCHETKTVIEVRDASETLIRDYRTRTVYVRYRQKELLQL